MKDALLDALKEAHENMASSQIAIKALLNASSNPLINAVLEILPDATVYAPMYDAGTINISEYSYGLDGFKDSVFMSKLERILDLAQWKQETKDRAESLGREYKFTHNNLTIRLIGYAKENNPTCRKVKIGEKIRTVVEEKFEIVCE
jgi:hypothetical protein